MLGAVVVDLDDAQRTVVIHNQDRARHVVEPFVRHHERVAGVQVGWQVSQVPVKPCVLAPPHAQTP